MSEAAVTPRAPPVTTNTAPSATGPRVGRTAQGTAASVTRSPAAERPTSTSGPPPNSSAASAAASSRSPRCARSRSIALAVASGHSSLAVLASAASPASHARPGSRPERPKSPPVSCTVTKTPPCSRKRAATARAAPKASRLTAMAASSATGRRPPRKRSPVAFSGIASTVARVASTPRARSASTRAGATPPPSGVTATRPLPTRPATPKPCAGAGTTRTATRATGANGANGADNGATTTRARGPPASVAPAACVEPPMSSMICASVRVAAIFDVATCGRSGTAWRIAERISTRLIESIPRSASMSIDVSIISTG